MHLTKTDYLEYTFCRKNLWLKKYKPELFEGVELSEFEKKIIEDGNVAEASCRELFPDGQLITSTGGQAVTDTAIAIQQGATTIFQATFQHDNFFLRADILRRNSENDGWELYEVKATNEVKRRVPHHHVHDLAFQKNVIEACGIRVTSAAVIHLNREYRKHGPVNFRELFVTEDVTDEVITAQPEVMEEMHAMDAYMHGPEEAGCLCVYEGRSNHCTTFAYSNPHIPKYSVHDLNRIGMSKKKLIDWIDQRVFQLEDITNPEDLNDAQRRQYDAYTLQRTFIDTEGIKERLDGLKFPLQFFDFEGYGSAIPKFDGFGAYEQVPFQYSLHILHADGSIDHKECLITEPSDDITRALVEQMHRDIDPNGTVVSWYASYEKQRITKLAELHPEFAPFLKRINESMFDLMTIFADGLFVDPGFKGSASIKKVLPVVVPSLTYTTLNIQKGDQASERWEKLISPTATPEEKADIKNDLLAYCKLDTWAMVEIYNALRKHCAAKPV